MNAVAERPARVKVIREPAPAERSSKTSEPTPGPGTPTKEFPASAIKLAFGQIGALLGAAHMTKESHEWSGDSCRLLRVAHGLAAQARLNPPEGFEIEDSAYDIAALVRSARLVPGDSESAERKALIDQAAVHINWLTECDAAGVNCCDPGIPRPAAPNAPPATAPDHETNTGYRELARQANYEIMKLAEALQTLTMHEGSEEHPVTYGIAARVRMLAEVVFHGAELHGTTREEIGTPELAELQRRVQGGL